MNDEIKEIFDTKLYFDLEEEDYIKIKDYITNLQQEIQKKEAMYDSLAVDYRLAQEENQRLKEKLNCKEYFSSTMPEDTEFVILTKNNYDRQQKDVRLELIDYKSRVEKAIDYIENNKRLSMFADCREPEENWNYDLECSANDLLNILYGETDATNKDL